MISALKRLGFSKVFDVDTAADLTNITIKAAVAHGLGNARKLLDRVKAPGKITRCKKTVAARGPNVNCSCQADG